MEQIESTDPEDRRSTNKNGTHEPGKRDLRDEAAVASFELVPGAARTVMARYDIHFLGYFHQSTVTYIDHQSGYTGD